jgi:hypothetical protein
MKRIGLMLAVFALFLFVQAARADWTPLKRLTWNSGASWCPAIAADPFGNVHVVWYDETPAAGFPEIYYKKSTDGGSTWTASKRLTWTSGMAEDPAIAVDSSGNVHVVWKETVLGYWEIYYGKSTDGGATWMSSQRLTWNARVSFDPLDIAVDSSGDVHVVWAGNTPGNYEICYRKTTNGGSAWMTSQRLTWNSGISYEPAIAVDSSGNPHVVWDDNTPGECEIYYKKTTNGGSAWMTSQRLTWNSGISYEPAIAVDSSGNPHVVWRDNTPGNNEIYYKKTTNGGATWMTSQRLTWNSGGSYEPAIAVDSSGNPYVVWHDDTQGYQIYFKKSTNRGSAWMTSQRLTSNSGYSGHPAIAVDSSGNVHVVWYDNMFGNYEICYRKYNK